MATNRPDIFIIGTMKGGTTALHRILTAHPDICTGAKKEIHYFSTCYAEGEEWYLDHFKDVPPGKRSVDASPTYFDMINSRQIPALINRFSPEAKIVLIARNPAERAISHFHHLKKVNKIADLQEMDADTFFAHDPSEMLSRVGVIAFNYMNVIRFSYYTQKAQVCYGAFKDRMLVIDNSQLRSAPKETVKRVFEHVGVDPIWNNDFVTIRHSHKTALSDVSEETFDRLTRLFRDDYQSFCKRWRIDYSWPRYDEHA